MPGVINPSVNDRVHIEFQGHHPQIQRHPLHQI
jgi:hypothetical protein